MSHILFKNLEYASIFGITKQESLVLRKNTILEEMKKIKELVEQIQEEGDERGYVLFVQCKEKKWKQLQQELNMIDKYLFSLKQQKQLNFKELINKAKEYPIINLLSNIQSSRGQKTIVIKSPLREDNKPSFVIYVNTNSAYDFALSESYDVIKLYQQLYNKTFKEAVLELSSF
jgi:hypothetical protein